MKNFTVNFWINTPDGYDNRWCVVLCYNKNEALELARIQNPRGKNFTIN